MIQKRLIIIARYLLAPVSLLYAIVMRIRNLLFDLQVLPSTRFDIPVIAVGNLSVGGTGKTPQIEYLIELLQQKYKVAVLSRGYKRVSKGFVLATPETDVLTLGDEPYQYKMKYPDVIVAVDTDRTNGIHEIRKKHPEVQVVLLDDAFQHRKVKAGFYVLLTSFDKPYARDFVLPLGDLREASGGYKRADAIVVTKCPEKLSESEKESLTNRLTPHVKKEVFFSKIAYAKAVRSETDSISIDSLKKYGVVLVTGIAKPQPLLKFLTTNGINFEHLAYPDHHHFSGSDIQQIENKFDALTKEQKIIITTEKDSTRLHGKLTSLYTIAITPEFLDKGEQFDTSILSFIKRFY